MKWILISAIYMYWIVTPASMRRRCLYKESCSRYVARRTREFGFLAGIDALRRRMRSCCGGYRLVIPDVSLAPMLRLRDGTMLPLNEASDAVTCELGMVLHGPRKFID